LYLFDDSDYSHLYDDWRRRRQMAYKTYSEDEQAHWLLQLEAMGHPGNIYAVKKVASQKGAPSIPTLKRWWEMRHNPEIEKLVQQKKETLTARLEDMAHTLLDAMGLDIRANGVDAVRAATALGIVVDKLQLLQDRPTGIIRIVELIQEGRVKPEAVRQRWPNLADDLFAKAGVKLDAGN
jgi:hypothetical protein